MTDNQRPIAEWRRLYLVAIQEGEFSPHEIDAIISAQQELVAAFPVLIARIEQLEAELSLPRVQVKES